MLEKEIERYLCEAVHRAGGLCYKWVSPGNLGVPDRIVVLPGGQVLFVELKSPTGSVSKLQAWQHKQLGSVGSVVRVLRSKEQVREFMEEAVSK